jgi:hypothetical protein
MDRSPLAYVRMRLARSIDARVSTAVQIANDTLRAEIARSFEDELARQRTAQRLQDAEYSRRLAELSELLMTKISDTSTSVGSISASITDQQRRDAEFVEQLARRIDALEQAHRASLAESPEPAS